MPRNLILALLFAASVAAIPLAEPRLPVEMEVHEDQVAVRAGGVREVLPLPGFDVRTIRISAPPAILPIRWKSLSFTTGNGRLQIMPIIQSRPPSGAIPATGDWWIDRKEPTQGLPVSIPVDLRPPFTIRGELTGRTNGFARIDLDGERRLSFYFRLGLLNGDMAAREREDILVHEYFYLDVARSGRGIATTLLLLLAGASGIALAFRLAALLPRIRPGNVAAFFHGTSLWLGRHAERLALGIVLASLGAELWVAASVLEKTPHFQDDLGYLLRAKWLASGHVTQPLDGLAPHLDIPFAVEKGGNWFIGYTIGWPAILALGQIFHAPWIVPALCGALSIWVLFLLGRDLYGAGTGLLAALFAALSPITSILSASPLSHAGTGLLILLSVYFAVRRGDSRPGTSGSWWRPNDGCPHPSLPRSAGEGEPPRSPAAASLPGEGVTPRSPAAASLPGEGVTPRSPAAASLPGEGVTPRSPAAASLPGKGVTPRSPAAASLPGEGVTPRSPTTVCPVGVGDAGSLFHRESHPPSLPSPARRGRAREGAPLALSGLFLGLAFCCRPLTAVAAGLPVGAFLALDALRSKEQRAARALVLFALFGALGTLPVWADNALTTGSPLLFGLELLGQGQRISNWIYGLHWMDVSLAQLSPMLFGWLWRPGAFPTLAFALPGAFLLPFLLRRAGARDWLLLAIFVSLVTGHLFHKSPGNHGFGPRYYAESVPFLLLLAAAGFTQASRQEDGRGPAARGLAAGALCGLLTVGALVAWPSRMALYRGYNNVDASLVRAVQDAKIQDGVIVLDPQSYLQWVRAGELLPSSWNDRLVVVGRSSENSALYLRYPDRPFFLWNRERLVTLGKPGDGIRIEDLPPAAYEIVETLEPLLGDP